MLPATNADYSDKDYDSLRARLFALIQSVYPDWTDTAVATFGNLLVELFAFVGDVLGFYQDAQAREAFVATAVQRRSLLSLAKLTGFVANTATAATADVLVSLTAPAVADVFLPNGSTVATLDVSGSVVFQVLHPSAEGYTIPAGQLSVLVNTENSAPAQDNFSATGLAGQDVPLSQRGYIDNTAIVNAGNGPYIQVPNFLASTSSDRHYTASVDENDRARLRFGNGVNGAVPTGTITVVYKTGGGTAGNVPAGSLRRIDGSFTDIQGNAVSLTAVNPTRAAGGAERTSSRRIQQLIPEQVRAPVNSTSHEDFIINAERLGQVARVLFLTRNQDPTIPENTGILFPLPVGGGLPSAALKELVRLQVTEVYPCQVTFQVLVLDPVFRQVDVSAVVHLAQSGPLGRAWVGAAVRKALTEFFQPVNADGTRNTLVDFGANIVDSQGRPSPQLAWSDVFNLVRDTVGVRKVDAGTGGLLLNGERADLTLGLREFPVLGTVSLVDADSGALF